MTKAKPADKKLLPCDPEKKCIPIGLYNWNQFRVDFFNKRKGKAAWDNLSYKQKIGKASERYKTFKKKLQRAPLPKHELKLVEEIPLLQEIQATKPIKRAIRMKITKRKAKPIAIQPTLSLTKEIKQLKKKVGTKEERKAIRDARRAERDRKLYIAQKRQAERLHDIKLYNMAEENQAPNIRAEYGVKIQPQGPFLPDNYRLTENDMLKLESYESEIENQVAKIMRGNESRSLDDRTDLIIRALQLSHDKFFR